MCVPSYHTQPQLLPRRNGRRCIYFGACVSDVHIHAVRHISELRPDALQLNFPVCVHSLDTNPVYIAKEVYFVRPTSINPAVPLKLTWTN